MEGSTASLQYHRRVGQYYKFIFITQNHFASIQREKKYKVQKECTSLRLRCMFLNLFEVALCVKQENMQIQRFHVRVFMLYLA